MRRVCVSVAGLWLFCSVSLLLICSTIQEVIYFKSEPLPYYYSYSGSVTLIPCVAVRVNDAGDEIPIAATLYRNSESFTTANRPNRHQVYLPDRVAAGVVVNPTLYEDAGTRYHCEVEDGEGEVVAVSTEARLLVGDGHPLQVKEIKQLDEGLYSVMLVWKAAPTPADSPILRYEITVVPVDQGSGPVTRTVEGNLTTTELTLLDPATTYQVTVVGVNRHGAGPASPDVTIMTIVPEVPRPPTNVMVEVVTGSTGTSMIITWTPSRVDPEVMTPLTNYIIHYGLEDGGEDMSVVVPGGNVSEFVVSGITTRGDVLVGVAAVNSAGSSQVAYYPHRVALSTSAEPLSSQKTIVIPAAVAGGLLLIIAVVLILIVAVRIRYIRLNRSHVIATSPFNNASPPLKRQKNTSNKHVQHIGVHNDVFEANGNTSRMALSVLEEPRAPDTPPSPEVTTFQTPPPSTNFPPSPNLPPSYSDLEDHTQTNSVRGFTNHCHNCSPPQESGIVGEGPTEGGGQAPLGVQYSEEPGTAGPSPTPQSRIVSTEWRRDGE
jgi:hypothetical protein